MGASWIRLERIWDNNDLTLGAKTRRESDVHCQDWAQKESFRSRTQCWRRPSNFVIFGAVINMIHSLFLHFRVMLRRKEVADSFRLRHETAFFSRWGCCFVPCVLLVRSATSGTSLRPAKLPGFYKASIVSARNPFRSSQNHYDGWLGRLLQPFSTCGLKRPICVVFASLTGLVSLGPWKHGVKDLSNLLW